MSLKFIIGNSGVGKTEYLYNWVIGESERDKERTYFYVVPEQFTMQTQRDLVQRHPRGGILNIEVQSFLRLAYRVFDEVGASLVPVLNDTGKMMVLRRVYEACKQQLHVLNISPSNPGGLDEVKSLLSECLLYDVDLEELSALADEHAMGGLGYKLRDVKLLSDQFFAYLETHYITSEQIMELLIRVADQSALLKNSVLILDGFTGFTPLQNRLIEKLLLYCRQVIVVITADPQIVGVGQLSEQHLFYLSSKTMRHLSLIARKQHVPVDEPLCFHPSENPRLSGAPALAHLEESIFRQRQRIFQKRQDAIRLYELAKPEQEALFAASEIARLVRSGECRYGQIAVVSGAMDQYEAALRRAFEEYDIPYFYDYKSPLLLNPMLEWIRAVLGMVAERFTCESVLRYFRCGLSELSDSQIDSLENYILECGIRGFSGYEQVWVYRGGDRTAQELSMLNEIREQFVSDVGPLVSVWENSDATVRDKTVILYEFMERKGLYDRLSEREQYYTSHGNLAKAKEYAQVYGLVIDLLDQYVELLGSERLPIMEYMQILDSGFADASVGVLPPGNDCVILGDVERTRLKEIDVLFFIGVNDGIIPSAYAGGGILSEAEREMLVKYQASLAPLPCETLAIQKYYLYLLLTKPRRRLYLTYSASTGAQEEARPSFLIASVRRLFSDMEIRRQPVGCTSLSDVQTWEELYRYMQNYVSGQSGCADTTDWTCACLVGQSNASFWERIRRMREAAVYQNREHGISAQTARQLFGSKLYGSATRMERYSACPFSHFIQYGLRLKPRKRLEFTPADNGTVFHEALEMYSSYLIAHRGEECTPEQTSELLERVLEEGIVRAGAQSLYRTARGTYHRGRMLRMLSRSAWVIQEQLSRGDFEMANYELDFSDHEGILPLTLDRENSLILTGRIDRMDVFAEDGRRYLRIIDYKSGSRSFSLSEWFHGLSLQLPLYLRAAVALQEKAHPDCEIIPAGIFLQHLDDPVLKLEPAETPEEYRDRLLQMMRLDGYVNEDYGLIQKMDHTFTDVSRIIPVKRNKNGSYSKVETKSLKTRHFQMMLDKNDEMLTRIGKGILEGITAISPYRTTKGTPCEYCTYHGICGFDRRIANYAYRTLPTYKTEDIFERLEEQYGSEVDEATETGD